MEQRLKLLENPFFLVSDDLKCEIVESAIKNHDFLLCNKIREYDFSFFIDYMFDKKINVVKIDLHLDDDFFSFLSDNDFNRLQKRIEKNISLDEFKLFYPDEINFKFNNIPFILDNDEDYLLYDTNKKTIAIVSEPECDVYEIIPLKDRIYKSFYDYLKFDIFKQYHINPNVCIFDEWKYENRKCSDSQFDFWKLALFYNYDKYQTIIEKHYPEIIKKNYLNFFYEPEPKKIEPKFKETTKNVSHLDSQINQHKL